MPLNDIVADVLREAPAPGDEAPEDDRAPDIEDQPETTMRTRPGYPPYLHHQTEKVVTVILTIGSLYSLAQLLDRFG